MDDDYSTVYSWFDKSGIISNIRTHLRQNLVNALKNRDLAQRFESTAPKSAKQYIYDLLVAEYLWNHNYAYTLSVFASEAPLLVNFNKHIRTNDEQGDTSAGQKLQNDYVCHTLETLGIEPTKAKGQSIIKNYAESDLPLLLCVLQYVGTKESKFYASEKEFDKDVRDQGVQTTETGETILNKLTKIATAKKKLMQQKNLFDAQLKQKEMELKEQTVLMEKQLLLLQEKLEHAQKLMQVCSTKEKKLAAEKSKENLRISQKENELAMREKLLSQEAIRLEKERDSYRQFEGNLKKLQDELSKAQREVPQKGQNFNLNYKDVEVQTDFESFVLARNERNLLSQEKQDLHGLVQAQQARIEQLTSRVVHLSRKLEETQLKTSRNTFELPSPFVKVLNTNTVVSESSSTDDIIQDAKNRLRRLEEESTRADQYYLNFINKSSN